MYARMEVWNHAWLNGVVCVHGRTSNSQWQESVDGLPAGCAFYDAPEVPCRVFKGKLEALLQGLRCGSIWGPRTLVSDVDGERVYKYQVHGRTGGSGYLIYVIEFQSRGLPHAHIVARPMDMPAGSECFGGAEPGTAQRWVDEFVCARKPTRDVLPGRVRNAAMEWRWGCGGDDGHNLAPVCNKAGAIPACRLDAEQEDKPDTHGCHGGDAEARHWGEAVHGWVWNVLRPRPDGAWSSPRAWTQAMQDVRQKREVQGELAL